ncbi:MAG: efflux RND transporter permease subunit, partial [Paracoccaceae bacterium]
VLLSVTVTALKPQPRKKPIKAGHSRRAVGWIIHLLVANPVMPIVTIALVLGFVAWVFMTFSENSLGVEFFVETEPDRAIAFVRARGNLGLEEKDVILREAERGILAVPDVASVFSFAGSGGLNQNSGGARPPLDAIGQVQIELQPWGTRSRDGRVVLAEIEARLKSIPGVQIEILKADMGPASGKPVNLRLTGENWQDLLDATAIVNHKFSNTKGLFRIEDTRPLPGIDWRIDVDVEKAGRYGADVVTVGAMVQLVTRGLLLDTMRVDSSDEEIDIRVRLPKKDRFISTLDTLKVRTPDGLIPLSNFISRKPVRSLSQIDRVDGARRFQVKADLRPDLLNAEGKPITADERIALLTTWLEAEKPLPASVSWSWDGDQKEQAESMAFLGKAFIGALGLMFVILLAQFNSVYNSVLVLLAVVLSTTGVLIGMMVMQQPFSVIMTGTGIVALAGIVVNNNIVLIDTYQEFSAYMPKLEAITRTVEARLRPVFLTTVTTIAGLTPMMFGVSVDFIHGGYTIDAPTALWWKQLATAVVFGLGIATVLTLVFTPSLLALRVWINTGAYRSLARFMALGFGRDSRAARDLAMQRAARRTPPPEIIWDDQIFGEEPEVENLSHRTRKDIRAAE